jgi:polysaccharide biosynthesis transport protein
LNTQGIETLSAVLRRSLWIFLLLIVFGVALTDVTRYKQGPQYQAQSQVVLSPTDLSQLFSGSSGFVDPNLVDQTEKALAKSLPLFDRAASRWAGTLGTGRELRDETTVSKDGTTISFTATGPSHDRVVDISNAVARAYPTWRAEVEGAAIQNAITQVQAQLRGSKNPPVDLVNQLNRLKVFRTLASGNVLLVEPADGAAKVRPRPIRDSIIGGLIGLFAALLVVAAREALDTRVRSEEEIEELLDVPVVGTVENLPRGTVLVAGGAQGERFGDMYALIAANLAQESDARPTVIAVTSATAREGKTTTASNLASALTRRNANVVLVDLDTRKPSVAKVFRIPSTAPGLEQAFRRNVSPESLTWTVSLNGAEPDQGRSPVAVAERVDNGRKGGRSLRVLPLKSSIRGGVAAHASQVRDVIAAVGEGSDYVVIDTPPALALPDMTELSKLVDLVVVVVRHGRVSRRNLSALNRLHRSWPVRKKSAVLVGVPRQDSYSYYEE